VNGSIKFSEILPIGEGWRTFSLVSIIKLFHRHDDNEGLQFVKIEPISAIHCRGYFGDLFTDSAEKPLATF
jgi:hypothetical protein